MLWYQTMLWYPDHLMLERKPCFWPLGEQPNFTAPDRRVDWVSSNTLGPFTQGLPGSLEHFSHNDLDKVQMSSLADVLMCMRDNGSEILHTILL